MMIAGAGPGQRGWASLLRGRGKYDDDDFVCADPRLAGQQGGFERVHGRYGDDATNHHVLLAARR